MISQAQIRRGIETAYRAALEAIDPEVLTARAVKALPRTPTTVIAIGKAAPAMVRGTANLEPDQVLVISNHDDEVPEQAEVIIGDHPVPTAQSRQAGERALEVARSIPADCLALFLISGGGSSLAEVPAPGISLDDLARTFAALTSAGAPIAEMNLVRRHLSAFKNGNLLRARGQGPSVSLLISDVIDGPPSDIASGPTMADASSAQDALDVFRRYAVDMPESVLRHLQNPSPSISEPVQDHTITILADRSTAADGAAAALESVGIPNQVVDSAITGDAASEAERVCGQASDVITIYTGETTVALLGEPTDGAGGRNQSAALAAAIALDGHGPGVFAALSTDGIDGPTDAAGAIVDETTAGRIQEAGLDPQAQLESNDANPALEAGDALVRTGPTGTNVGDIWCSWRG